MVPDPVTPDWTGAWPTSWHIFDPEDPDPALLGDKKQPYRVVYEQLRARVHDHWSSGDEPILEISGAPPTALHTAPPPTAPPTAPPTISSTPAQFIPSTSNPRFSSFRNSTPARGSYSSSSSSPTGPRETKVTIVFYTWERPGEVQEVEQAEFSIFLQPTDPIRSVEDFVRNKVLPSLPEAVDFWPLPGDQIMLADGGVEEEKEDINAVFDSIARIEADWARDAAEAAATELEDREEMMQHREILGYGPSDSSVVRSSSVSEGPASSRVTTDSNDED
ncbi:hypothetical protein N7451_012734 [Penicillium sp. IBT 35674x]|nr:hypothetical protein N7451_012734 [Penicillium sp. IBT 35674x]